MSPEPLTPHEQRQFALLSQSLSSDGEFNHRVGKVAKAKSNGIIPGRYVLSGAILIGVLCLFLSFVSIFNTGGDPFAMFRFGMLALLAFAVAVNSPNAWREDLRVSRQVWRETRKLKKWKGDDWGEEKKPHTV